MPLIHLSILFLQLQLTQNVFPLTLPDTVTAGLKFYLVWSPVFQVSMTFFFHSNLPTYTFQNVFKRFLKFLMLYIS